MMLTAATTRCKPFHTMTNPRAPTSTTADAPTAIATPASPWRRLAGLVYDLVAVVAIVMVVGMICEAATLGRLDHLGSGATFPWWYQPLQYLVVAAYFVVSWWRGGQTLGMRPWRMRLRTATGKRVPPRAAITRAAAASLPLLLLALGAVAGTRAATLAALLAWVAFFGVSLFDPRRRALHDLLAGTVLVQFEPPPRTSRKG